MTFRLLKSEEQINNTKHIFHFDREFYKSTTTLDTDWIDRGVRTLWLKDENNIITILVDVKI